MPYNGQCHVSWLHEQLQPPWPSCTHPLAWRVQFSCSTEKSHKQPAAANRHGLQRKLYLLTMSWPWLTSNQALSMKFDWLPMAKHLTVLFVRHRLQDQVRKPRWKCAYTRTRAHTPTHPPTHPHTFSLRCACCCLLEVSAVSLVVLAIRLALFFIVTHTHTHTHARTHARTHSHAHTHHLLRDTWIQVTYVCCVRGCVCACMCVCVFGREYFCVRMCLRERHAKAERLIWQQAHPLPLPPPPPCFPSLFFPLHYVHHTRFFFSCSRSTSVAWEPSHNRQRHNRSNRTFDQPTRGKSTTRRCGWHPVLQNQLSANDAQWLVGRVVVRGAKKCLSRKWRFTDSLQAWRTCTQLKVPDTCDCLQQEWCSVVAKCSNWCHDSK